MLGISLAITLVQPVLPQDQHTVHLPAETAGTERDRHGEIRHLPEAADRHVAVKAFVED